MDDEEIDISAFLQNLTQHTTVQSLTVYEAKQFFIISKAKNDEPLPYSFKTFITLDISDSSHLKYFNNLDTLLVKWENSFYLVIKRVPILLKY